MAGYIGAGAVGPHAPGKGVPANALRLNGVPLRLNGTIILMVTA